MINKLLLVLLFLLVIPNYSQDLIVKNHQQSILVKPNLTKQFHYFEKNDLSDNTQKTNELNNGNLIWITDVSMNIRISPIPQTIVSFPEWDGDEKHLWAQGGRVYLTSDLGALRRINKNIGFGISHFIGMDLSDEPGLRNGIKLKYRQWLKNGSFFDISPGIIYFDWCYNERYGFTGSIDWWRNERFALTMLIEYLSTPPDVVEYGYDEDGRKEIWRTKEYEKDFGIYLGIKAGSKVGLIGNGIYYGIILFLVIVGSTMG